MKSLLTFALLIVLVAGTALSAERPIRVTVTPAIGVKSGYTKFVMNFRYAWTEDVIGSIKSELEYPLDVTVGGLQVSVRPNASSANEWGIEAGFVTNFNDPGNVMKDFDWEYAPGYFNERIGYTESRSKLSLAQLSLEGFKAVVRKPAAACGVLGGFRYQKLSQDIMGLEGSYLIVDTNNLGIPDEVTGKEDVFEQNILALKYKVTYAMPYVGLFGRVSPIPVADVTVKAAIAAVFASDSDDHVLRTRLAEASGNGKAFIGGAQLRLRPTGTQKNTGLFFQTDVDIVSLAVKTTGNQEWYGEADGVPVGTTISGVPHQFTSRQVTLFGRVGMTF